MNLFAKRLKEMREEKGISQNQLSSILGISQKAISQWELATSSPTKENIIALAKFFECTSDYLIGMD